MREQAQALSEFLKVENERTEALKEFLTLVQGTLVAYHDNDEKIRLWALQAVLTLKEILVKKVLRQKESSFAAGQQPAYLAMRANIENAIRALEEDPPNLIRVVAAIEACVTDSQRLRKKR